MLGKRLSENDIRHLPLRTGMTILNYSEVHFEYVQEAAIQFQKQSAHRFTVPVYPYDLSKAKRIQDAMKGRVRLQTSRTRPTYIAGVDCHAVRGTDRLCTAAALLRFDDLRIIETVVIETSVKFPYISGYLSFREVPPIVRALNKLSRIPDIVICDGQGTAHPKRFGLACHLGVVTDLPTIGAAKSRLIGEYIEPDLAKGSRSMLYHKNEAVGIVLRTRDAVKPLFVSAGHSMTHARAADIVLQATGKYRLPETTRAAHKAASAHTHQQQGAEHA